MLPFSVNAHTDAGGGEGDSTQVECLFSLTRRRWRTEWTQGSGVIENKHLNFHGSVIIWRAQATLWLL
jgi:hypothetical protein